MVLLDVFESRFSIDFQWIFQWTFHYFHGFSIDFHGFSIDFHGVSGPSKVAQVPLRDSVDPPSALKARSLWAMFHWGRVA